MCLCQHVCISGQEMEGVSEFGGIERLGEKRDEADAISQLGQR